MKPEDVRKIADGRVFTGRQAKQLGLVDELGNFYDAVNDAARLAGLKRYRVKEYGRMSPLERLISRYAGEGTALPGVPPADWSTGSRLLDVIWFLKDLVKMPQDAEIR